MKQSYKHLKEIADRLPTQRYEYLQKHVFDGDLVKDAGLLPEEDPGYQWERRMNHEIKVKEVNHFRRIKRAYKKGGKAAVYKYMLPFVDVKKRFSALKYIHNLPI